MSDFTVAELAELRTGLSRFGLFFNLATTPTPCRWWAGVGNIQPGVNAVDLSSGATYKGAGEIVEYDDLLSLFDGTSSRISLSVQHVPANVFSEIATDLADQQLAIQGKEVYIGWVAMDYSWAPLSAVHWEWSGFADGITVKFQASTTAEEPEQWSLTLSCGDWLTGIRRPGLSFMADNDQRTRALLLNPLEPSDRFCERVGLYSLGTEKTLPVIP